VELLVCSDAMARGMDFEGLTVVINYDAPQFVKTYVHRVGRTARAGKRGRCFTLVVRPMLSAFKNMLRKADNNYVLQTPIGSREYAPYVERYTEVLGELKTTLETERREGSQKTTAKPPATEAAEEQPQRDAPMSVQDVLEQRLRSHFLLSQ